MKRAGVKTGVRRGARLRKVVEIRFFEDPVFGPGYVEVLECGHEGRVVGDAGSASKRWCYECPRTTPKPRQRVKRGTPFWDRVDKSGGPDACWEWTAGRDVKGYGSYHIDGRAVKAHRHAHVLVNGPIPGGYLVCHRCDNPPCVNPAHLFVGTHRDNALDAKAKGRTRAPRGAAHPKAKFTDEQIARVIELREAGWSNLAIAEETGISSSYCSRLGRRQRRAAA